MINKDVIAQEICITDLYPGGRMIASTSLDLLLRSLDLEQFREKTDHPDRRSIHPLALYFASGVELTSKTLNHHRRLVHTHTLGSHST